MQDEYTAPSASLLMSTREARSLLIAEYGNFCFRCFMTPAVGELPLAVDHIVPVARGGLDIYSNYELLCLPCNSWKGTKIIDFRPGTRSLALRKPPEIIPLWERSRQKPAPFLLAGALSADTDGKDWVSLPEYSRRSGIPESTVRAMIRDGKIAARQRRRSPGSLVDLRIVYELLAPDVPLEEDVASEADQPQTTLTEPPAATMRLLDMLSERDATVERLHGELLAATERAARAEALAEARESALEWTQAQLDAARADLERARRPWWKWW